MAKINISVSSNSSKPNITISKGPVGPQGEQGIQGEQGEQGPEGNVVNLSAIPDVILPGSPPQGSGTYASTSQLAPNALVWDPNYDNGNGRWTYLDSVILSPPPVGSPPPGKAFVSPVIGENLTNVSSAGFTALSVNNGTIIPNDASLYVNGTSRFDGPVQVAANGVTVYALPVADGSPGQFMKTDGSGVVTFATPSVSDLSDGSSVMTTDTTQLVSGGKLFTSLSSFTNGLTVTNGPLNASGVTANLGTVVASGSVTTTQLNFASGASTIATAFGTSPEDLEIYSDGNVRIILDHNDDQASQKFVVSSSDDSERFSVQEDGVVRISNAYNLPSSDGSANYFLKTDGSGQLYFATVDGTSGNTAASPPPPPTYEIDDLTDVDTTTVAPLVGQALVWDGSQWEPGDSFSQSDFDTAFGNKSIDALSDVEIAEPYDPRTYRFKARTVNDSVQQPIQTLQLARGLFFKPDGTRMFVADENRDRIFQYDLSTAWDITTAVQQSDFIATGNNPPSANTPRSIVFSSDGTKLFLCDNDEDRIQIYTLSTGWDLSTATFDTDWLIATYISGYTNNSISLAISSDGLTAYIGDYSTNQIHQVSLDTAWTFDSNAVLVGSIDFDNLWASYDINLPPLPTGVNLTSFALDAYGLWVNSDGTRLIASFTTEQIVMFSMSPAYDITSLVYLSHSSLPDSRGPSDPSQIYISESSNNLYVASSNNFITQYSMGDAKEVSGRLILDSVSVNKDSFFQGRLFVDQEIETLHRLLAPQATITGNLFSGTARSYGDVESGYNSTSSTHFRLENGVSQQQNVGTDVLGRSARAVTLLGTKSWGDVESIVVAGNKNSNTVIRTYGDAQHFGDQIIDGALQVNNKLSLKDSRLTPSGTVVHNDTFTEASDTDLAAHTPDIGSGYTIQYSTNANANIIVVGGGGYARKEGAFKTDNVGEVATSNTTLPDNYEIVWDLSNSVKSDITSVNSTFKIFFNYVDSNNYDVIRLSFDADGSYLRSRRNGTLFVYYGQFNIGQIPVAEWNHAIHGDQEYVSNTGLRFDFRPFTYPSETVGFVLKVRKYGDNMAIVLNDRPITEMPWDWLTNGMFGFGIGRDENVYTSDESEDGWQLDTLSVTTIEDSDFIIDSYVENGNFGIGTATPAYGLHLKSSNNFKLTSNLGSSGEEVTWLQGIGRDLEWRSNGPATQTIKAWTGSSDAHAYQRFYPSGGETWSHGVYRTTNQYRVVDGLDISVDANARIVVDGGTGNVGIGTTTPAAALHIAGANGEIHVEANSLTTKMIFAGSNVIIGTGQGSTLPSTGGHVKIGHESGRLNMGQPVVAIGNGALKDNSGQYHVAIGNTAGRYGGGSFGAAVGDQAGQKGMNYGSFLGYQAGQFGSGNGNLAVGYQAAKGVNGTSTFANTVAVGYQALTALTTGTGNTAVGYQAGDSVLAGTDNTLIGYGADLVNGNNSFNTVVGSATAVSSNNGRMTAVGWSAKSGGNSVSIGALSGSASANDSIAIGYQAGNGAGNSNVSIGGSAHTYSSGTGNVSVGNSANRYTSGDYNVVLGQGAAYGVSGTSTFSNTVAVGYQALTALTTGAGNTAVGYQAGIGITTAGYNTIVGYSADVGTSNSSTVMGYQASGDGSGVVSIGYQTQGGVVTNGYQNTGVGYRANYQGASEKNVSIGTNAGYSGSIRSVSIGHSAGYSGGDYSVFIGYEAGYNETGSNKLYIENSNSATPLIYGEFDNDIVRVNGDFGVRLPSMSYDSLSVGETVVIKPGVSGVQNTNNAAVYVSRDGSTSADVVALNIGSNIMIKRNGGGTPYFYVNNTGFIYQQSYNGDTATNTNPFNNGAGMGVRNNTPGTNVILALDRKGVFGALNSAGSTLNIGNPYSCNDNWAQEQNVFFRNSSSFGVRFGDETNYANEDGYIIRSQSANTDRVDDYRHGLQLSAVPNFGVSTSGGRISATNGSNVLDADALGYDLRGDLEVGDTLYIVDANVAHFSTANTVYKHTITALDFVNETITIDSNYAGTTGTVAAFAQKNIVTVRNWDGDVMTRVKGTGEFQIGSDANGYAFPTATGTLGQVLEVDANGDLIFATPSGGGGGTPLASADQTLTGDRLIDTNGYNLAIELDPTGTADTFTIHDGTHDLFEVNTNTSGTLFSVNDVSGLPTFQSNDDGSAVLPKILTAAPTGTATEGTMQLGIVSGTCYLYVYINGGWKSTTLT